MHCQLSKVKVLSQRHLEHTQPCLLTACLKGENTGEVHLTLPLCPSSIANENWDRSHLNFTSGMWACWINLINVEQKCCQLTWLKPPQKYSTKCKQDIQEAILELERCESTSAHIKCKAFFLSCLKNVFMSKNYFKQTQKVAIHHTEQMFWHIIKKLLQNHKALHSFWRSANLWHINRPKPVKRTSSVGFRAQYTSIRVHTSQLPLPTHDTHIYEYLQRKKSQLYQDPQTHLTCLFNTPQILYSEYRGSVFNRQDNELQDLCKYLHVKVT
jgi:hypothetical protein